MQWRPASVVAGPATGTIPTGYLVLNVTTGHIKRHAGGYVWEVPGGVGSTPTAQRTNAKNAAATDLASVTTLANGPRAALIERSLIKGKA